MINIRKATIKDAKSIAKIHSKTWQVAYEGLIHPDVLARMTYERRLEYFMKVLDTDKEENWIAYYNGAPAGFMTIGGARDKDLSDTDAEVWGIYVHPDFWNKSVGKHLMEFAEKTFQDRKYDRIYLWTLESNERARNFYEKRNYQLDGQEKYLKLVDEVKVVRYKKDI